MRFWEVKGMSDIENKLAAVRERISAARARSPYGQAVTLVAVTKFHPLSDMEEAVKLGVTVVGENRVQEMEEKRRESAGALPVRWHLLGHLQKNKVKKAVAIADLIQSGDSYDVLTEISRRAAEIEKVQDVLLEFNISGEEAKTGFSPDDFSEVVSFAETLPHVRVRGLMCMAPLIAPEETRPVFHKGYELWMALRETFPDAEILSMGMTNDFEIAIEEGANMVRIGTAIFGERVYR